MVFVTGGTGLLGSHVLVELSKRNQHIRALKRNQSSLETVKSVFEFYLEDSAQSKFDQIEWVNGDILDITSLENAMAGCTEVYHCAGYVSFTKKDFSTLMKINKHGTANVVNVALSNGTEKFCHVSSTAALGRQKNNSAYTENNKWVTSSENSNYAVSKYLSEMEVWRGIEEGLNATIVNPCVILGAGNWNESSLEIFRTVKKGIKFYSSGTNAFVDARDVAFCMVELMSRDKMKERYLTIGENVPFKQLLDMIADELEVKRPTIGVKKWMTGLAWRLEKFKCFFTGATPKITKETARSAMSVSTYSNQKIRDAITVNFTPVSETVKLAVDFQKKYPLV